MTDGLHIEMAAAGDYLKVAALDRIAWPDAPDVFIPDGEHVWRLWCEFATMSVARKAGVSLEQSDDIAGAAVRFPTRQGGSFLHKVMVHPSMRGQGIGTQLMEHVLDAATTDVFLTVDPTNVSAIRVYEKLGFEIRETVPGYYRAHEDRHVMVYRPR